jgi:GTP-binding protein
VFVDELEFNVLGGKGGDGCVSFRREKFVPRGGPNGGDGGRGGDVVLATSVHESTLYHLAGRSLYAAAKGKQGGSADCTGASADHLYLKVPVGTVVMDAERGHVLKDLSHPEESFVVARGGAGGRGNTRFASATNRTPRHAEEGQPGEDRRIRLSLKLIADVGLLGLPNAGKSTLLSTLSRARPRIADYPFTTLEPSLGIVPLNQDLSFVMADIPGLIEGAHEGKGLGDKFLKHIERTRVLLHLVDCSSESLEEPEEAWRVIRGEISSYSSALAERPCLLAATKVEDDASRARAEALAEASGSPVWSISAATREGLDPLLRELWRLLSQQPD